MNKKKNLLKLYLRTAMLLCVILTPTVNNPGRAQAGSHNTTPKAPNAYELTILVNGCLSALNHANRTGNYSVLHDLGAPSFRHMNSQKKLGQIFAAHRRRKLDISAALLYAPVFTTTPKIDAKGYLHLKGHMPTEPFHLNFPLVFEKSDRQWRIMALSIAPAISHAQVVAQR